MIYERIVETILYRTCKLIEIVLIKVVYKRRNNFIVKHLIHETCDIFILHTISYNILTCKICTEHKSCMCSVENTNLTMFVWHYIRNNMDIDTRFLKRKSVFKFFGAFNYPYAKNLTDINELIVVSVFSFKLLNFFFIADTSRNNSVYKG